MQLSPVFLQIYSAETFRRFPCSSPWFLMVPLGYPWLSLVILGYPWLSLVIYDSNICEIVCAFAIIFPVICRNLLQSRPDKRHDKGNFTLLFCSNKKNILWDGETLNPALV